MHQAEITNTNSNKNLSVLIHQDGLSFYVHTSSQVVKEIHRDFKYASNPIEILTAIESCYERETDLQQEFDDMELLYHHNIFAVVPNTLFQESQTADYLKYNTRILPTDVISVDDSIDPLEARLVYIAYSNINNFFYDKYGDYTYKHFSTPLLEYLSKNDDGAYLTIFPSHFYLSVLQDDSLIGHNIYPYENEVDILYYTLFAMEQYALDPETLKVWILQKEENKDLFELLYTYFRYVEPLGEHSKLMKQILCA